MLALRMRKRAPHPMTQAPASDPSDLPRDLLLALENATVVLRAAGPDDGVRAVVQVGDGGFMSDDARAQLLRRWPGLTDAQLQRAVRMVGNLVRRAASQTTRERARWATSW